MSFVSPRLHAMFSEAKVPVIECFVIPSNSKYQLTNLLQNFLSKEVRSVLLSSWKHLSKFWSLQKFLNVLKALSVAVLVDLKLLSRRSCSISSSVLV